MNVLKPAKKYGLLHVIGSLLLMASALQGVDFHELLSSQNMFVYSYETANMGKFTAAFIHLIFCSAPFLLTKEIWTPHDVAKELALLTTGKKKAHPLRFATNADVFRWVKIIKALEMLPLIYSAYIRISPQNLATIWGAIKELTDIGFGVLTIAGVLAYACMSKNKKGREGGLQEKILSWAFVFFSGLLFIGSLGKGDQFMAGALFVMFLSNMLLTKIKNFDPVDLEIVKDKFADLIQDESKVLEHGVVEAKKFCKKFGTDNDVLKMQNLFAD